LDGNRGAAPRHAKKAEPPSAKDGPGKLGSNCQTVGGYAELIVEVTVLKVALICEPSPRAAAMMPTAIKAAMRPCSAKLSLGFLHLAGTPVSRDCWALSRCEACADTAALSAMAADVAVIQTLLAV
jgi:hypothetical protein